MGGRRIYGIGRRLGIVTTNKLSSATSYPRAQWPRPVGSSPRPAGARGLCQTAATSGSAAGRVSRRSPIAITSVRRGEAEWPRPVFMAIYRPMV